MMRQRSVQFVVKPANEEEVIMDKSLHSLDHHFNLPAIRLVDSGRPLQWLKRGWSDLRDNALPSLAFGVFFAVLGYLIMSFAAQRPYLLTAAVSGFFLIGPLAAAGLYEISRRHESGQPTGLGASLRGMLGHRDALLSIGVVLVMVAIAWERLSAILFALLVPDAVVGVSDFFRQVFLSGEHLGFVASYVVIGGVVAALVFACTAVAVPMLMDRDTDTVTAMMTSLRAVSMNLPAMLLWAALIVVLIGIGFATMMIGMVVLLPLVGHASWHAYKDLVA
jgi:uncharacterized membrane protein